MTFEPEIKTVEPETVAFISMHGPYSQIPQAFGQLYGWVAQHGLSATGMPEAVYLTMPDESDPDAAQWELWAPLAGDAAECQADSDGCGFRHVGQRKVAYAMHHGPYELIGETYGPLMQWVTTNGFQMAGPPEEVYFSDPGLVAPEDYLTEVRVPVA